MEQVLQTIALNTSVVGNIDRKAKAPSVPAEGEFAKNGLSPSDAYLLLRDFTSTPAEYGPFGRMAAWTPIIEIAAENTNLWYIRQKIGEKLKEGIKHDSETGRFRDNPHWKAMGYVFRTLRTIFERVEFFGKTAAKFEFIVQFGDFAFWNESSGVTNNSKLALIPIIHFLAQHSMTVFG